MTEGTKLDVTLYIEGLDLKELENLTEMWLDEPIPKLNLNCIWCETPDNFIKRKRFILPLLISKKLEIYEKEYPISDI